MKYELVAQDLTAKIHDGIYPTNARLPTTLELCESYHVSKVTVKQAMDLLEERGIISRRRGSGVYVKGLEPALSPLSGVWSPQSQMEGLTVERAVLGETVTSEVLEFTVERPPVDVANALQLAPGEFVYYVCRVRSSDGSPLLVEYLYLPIRFAPELRESHLEGSLYSYLEGGLGLKIGSAHRSVRAVLPSPEEAEWLHIQTSEPLLEVNQVRFLDNGTPLEYSTARHCGGYALHSINTR